MICFFKSVERGVLKGTTFVSAFSFLLSRVNEDGINLRTLDIQALQTSGVYLNIISFVNLSYPCNNATD